MDENQWRSVLNNAYLHPINFKTILQHKMLIVYATEKRLHFAGE